MTPTRGRPPRRAAGLLLALLAGGCGLADYEEQVAEARTRVANFDKENKELGEPLAIPLRTREEKDESGKARKVQSPVGNFFLRPPKAVRTQADAEPVNGLLYRFPAGTNGFKALYLAAADDPKEFPGAVLRAFPHDDQPAAKRWSVKLPEPSPPLDFDVTQFGNGDDAYTALFYPPGRPTLALVFCTERSRRQALEPLMELSLSTFATGTEADRLKRAYNQRKTAAQGGGRK